MSDYNTKAKEIINSHQFVQFSANWCPDCVYANSVWSKFGVSDKVHVFDIGNLSKDEQAQWRDAFESVSKIRNLPTIFVNGKAWGTESELHKYESKGTLKDELSKIGLIN
ncbi:hypothetical protein Kpol_337p4 [Vanderwaltozyma polyspora DSM 70294]|uniref:Glutaredoxin domain-containing protein n=1 Tax=Vanderwaltozyma polyspora (strain ATCC 22028 / DSM 70294 / BCRC 21397 / CBS 2163 / NBRC 10782 / NRRL Y-8283 / UCD 57-17) TaxID=436907 RepID=A7TT26_VANPO|nr:uncharacterized protein Kpol_337p4 [Vanderwaltozyma polyspora DSM 70294]EDO14582.1 hypothetical protein Kpol_337p4 [Vanderwaltozyma polyspora DSM 70294]